MKVEEAIKACKKKGFNYFKAELEVATGDIIRKKPPKHKCNNGRIDCPHCNGSGVRICSYCSGLGYTVNDQGIPITCQLCLGFEPVCPVCEGTREIGCPQCLEGEYGRSCTRNRLSREEAKNLILEKLPQKLKNKLIYSKVYNDPSVDIEWTFTIKIEDFPLMTDYIKTFVSVLKPISSNWQTWNAGMHLSLMSESDPNKSKLNLKNFENLKANGQNLLMGLYSLATVGEKTRAWHFRGPAISLEQKGSAIFGHGGNYLEFRVFDPCYEKPERVKKYLKIMAGMLKYYSTKPEIIPEYVGEQAMKIGGNGGMRDENGKYFKDCYENDETIERVKFDIEKILGKPETKYEIKRAGLLKEV